MRWAFWRSDPAPPQRALPDDVGLTRPARPAAAPIDPDDADDREHSARTTRTSGATPSPDPRPRYEASLTAPAPDVERAAVAAAGPALTAFLSALRSGSSDERHPDERTLAVAATGALAVRLPALAGVDGAGASRELEDELLHAYADLLATRAHSAQPRAHADRDDLLAVAHVAAAAVAADAAAEPALLLLADVPAGAQLRAAALLLAQTADDGAATLDELPREVRGLFGAAG